MNSQKTIDDFVNSPIEKNMDVLINWGKSKNMQNEEIAYLANKLANSGSILTLPEHINAVDIPSTGGPSSLSTIICPLFLKEFNCWIPKLGIQGRPAGGIDILYQIPDYRIDFTINEILECLKKNSYCHFNIGNEFVPLDAKLFKYRDKVNAKNIPSLVIASILSKKIAAGLNLVGLDVRVSSYGNFGNNIKTAINNSQRFIEVAKLLNIKAKCFLSDNNQFQQPYIGRGEGLIAIYEIINGNIPELLRRHLFRCLDMSIAVVGSNGKMIESPFDIIKKNFINNIEAQGSNLRKFNIKVEELRSQHVNEIKSDRSGFLNINLKNLRRAIVKGQIGNIEPNRIFSDPCGVILKKNPNDFVSRNEVILTYRVKDKIKDNFLSSLLKSIKLNCNIKDEYGYKRIN